MVQDENDSTVENNKDETKTDEPIKDDELVAVDETVKKDETRGEDEDKNDDKNKEKESIVEDEQNVDETDVGDESNKHKVQKEDEPDVEAESSKEDGQHSETKPDVEDETNKKDEFQREDEPDVEDENNKKYEPQKEDEPDVEERLRSMLESAMKSTEKMDKISEESFSEYTNRLSSFSPLTYFGKPSCLSPLVCARLGWRNAEPDLLVCSSCHAALAVTLITGLSADSKAKIVQIYREKLATCHKPICPFTVVAKEYQKCEKDSENDSILPSYMMDVFPSECVELVEHPRPLALLQRRVERLQENCPEGFKFPQELDIPQNERQELEDGAKLLKTTEESVGILSILGWEPKSQTKQLTDATEGSARNLTFGCRFCFSSMEIALEKEVEEETRTTEGPPAKRTRLSKPCAPLDAHRHYCPYVCGFPNALFAPKKQMWKPIVARLHKEREEEPSLQVRGKEQQEQEQQQKAEEAPMTEEDYERAEKEYDQTVYRINDILNSAIAPVNPRMRLALMLEDDI